MNYNEIADALYKTGYRSQRTKGVLTPGGVQRLLFPPLRVAKKDTSSVTDKEHSLLAAVRAVLSTDIDDTCKLKAIRGLLF
jgi:hypothetical protein